MSKSVAVMMEEGQLENRTTMAMVREIARRGYAIYLFVAVGVSLKHGGRVHAKAQPLIFDAAPPAEGPDYKRGEHVSLDLNTVDAVLVREDRAFNMAYVSAMLLLERLDPRVAVVNNPVSLRTRPGKLLPTFFPELIPPTLITNNRQEIEEFRKAHQDVIIKPLYGLRGSSVFHLTPESKNLGSLLDTMFEVYREPMVVQKYLPEIQAGDKRIMLIEGEPVAAVSRFPSHDDVRSNISAGGTVAACSLSERDLEICSSIGPTLRDMGLTVIGIDVIGPWLIEINMLSPGGFGHMQGDGLEIIAQKTADAVEARMAQARERARGGGVAASLPAARPAGGMLGRLLGWFREKWGSGNRR
jgi:glutathione synthase